jgi:hypothetical protein
MLFRQIQAGHGGEFLSNKNEEILTATTSEGDTSFLVCKTESTNANQKVCTNLQNETAKPTASTKNENGMLNNNTYNLVGQLVVENKSLWRIKNNYKNDSNMDTENKELRNFIEKDKEELVKLLTEKLRERL